MLVSTIFLKKKKVPERKECDPKCGRRGVVLIIPISGKKGFGTPFQLASF
jgi:hypothetical protein